MIEKYFPLILALVISVIYYYSNKHRVKNKNSNKKIVSFSAGVSITYVLLELFPTFTEGALGIDKLLFIAIPIGFIIHHIIEKEIYKHNTKHELIRMLSLEESVFSFIYHIIIGIVLVTLSQRSTIESFLFFIPMLSYTFLNNLPMNPHASTKKAIILSSATLLGVVFTMILGKFIPGWVEVALIGFATGVLLFAIIRHHIPFGGKGEIGFFTLGFLIYTLLIISSWYV